VKHLDKVEWGWLFKYQTLPESFIEKYMNKGCREDIWRYQKLSEAFIERYAQNPRKALFDD